MSVFFFVECFKYIIILQNMRNSLRRKLRIQSYSLRQILHRRIPIRTLIKLPLQPIPFPHLLIISLLRALLNHHIYEPKHHLKCFLIISKPITRQSKLYFQHGKVVQCQCLYVDFCSQVESDQLGK